MEAIPAYISAIIAILLLTSFLKVFTSLNILRYGLGLQGGGFGLVVVGASLALTLLIMTPQISAVGGLSSLFNSNLNGGVLEKGFRPFLERHTQKDLKDKLDGFRAKLLAGAPEAEQEKSNGSFSALITAFVFSELREAFQMGVILLLPFVIIDIIVANLLALTGICQMPVSVVSLPLKLLLFFAVDGWSLISEKLIGTYL